MQERNRDIETEDPAAAQLDGLVRHFARQDDLPYKVRWMLQRLGQRPPRDTLVDLCGALASSAIGSCCVEVGELSDPLLVRLLDVARPPTADTDFVDALEQLEELVWDCRRQQATRIMVWAMSALGRALAQAGLLDLSAEALTRCIELCRVMDVPAVEVIALSNLGMLYGQENEAEAYEKHTREALALACAIEERFSEAHCLCNLAGALAGQRNFEEAGRHYDLAEPIAREEGFTQVLAQVYAGRASLLLEAGRLEECHREHQRAIEAFLAIEDTYGRIRADLLRAEALGRNGQVKQALALVAEAERCAQASGIEGLQKMASHIDSDLRAAHGDFEGAHAALSRYVEALRRSKVRELRDARRLAVRAREEAQEFRERHEQGQLLEQERRRVHRLTQDMQSLAAQRNVLEHESRTDALTGVANRRAVDDAMSRYFTDDGALQSRMALLLLDLDHFKRVNDQYGHDVGDRALKLVAGVLIDEVRSGDVVGRWGGEEFVVILSGTETDLAPIVAERLRQAVERAILRVDAVRVPLTASVGLAIAGESDNGPESLFRRADAALYEAKRRGRNQCVAL